MCVTLKLTLILFPIAFDALPSSNGKDILGFGLK
jgi:hypothetical protein